MDFLAALRVLSRVGDEESTVGRAVLVAALASRQDPRLPPQVRSRVSMAELDEALRIVFSADSEGEIRKEVDQRTADRLASLPNEEKRLLASVEAQRKVLAETMKESAEEGKRRDEMARKVEELRVERDRLRGQIRREKGKVESSPTEGGSSL